MLDYFIFFLHCMCVIQILRGLKYILCYKFSLFVRTKHPKLPRMAKYTAIHNINFEIYLCDQGCYRPFFMPKLLSHKFSQVITNQVMSKRIALTFCRIFRLLNHQNLTELLLFVAVTAQIYLISLIFIKGSLKIRGELERSQDLDRPRTIS